MSYNLDDLLYLMRRLRDPDGGCPWDLAQDFQSITPSTIEEAYELVDAIYQLHEQGDAENARQVQEELGDLLFQVVFYSQMGQEKGWFGFADVVDSIAAKLVRRHPHVFPDGDLHGRYASPPDTETIKQQWESIKEEERRGKAMHGVLDDVPLALPALARAQKLQKRASRVGFDWPDARSALTKIREELDELEQALQQHNTEAVAEEMGDFLFSCVNVARHLKVDAETALGACNRKFEKRFRYLESQLQQQGRSPEDVSLMEMDSLWQQAKHQLD